MEHILLIVDMGTQSLRASLVSEERGILAFDKEAYEEPYFSVAKDFAEQHPDYYLEQLCKATNKLKAANEELFDKAEGMVLVSFRDTSVILDENKEPIRPSILWLDQRTAKIENQWNLKWFEKALFGIIGMTDTVRYNSARTPSFWIMENEPENWEKMRWYVPLTCYFNYKMTGNLQVSVADCIGHYPINYPKGKWYPNWHPKIDVFKIPLKACPDLVPAGEVLGYITEEFSERSGIKAGLPLYASASDKACETLGDGVIDEDEAAISLGTACTIDVVSHKYKEPEAFLPSYPTPYNGDFDYEIQIYRGLWMLRWFGEQFCADDLAKAKAEGKSYEEFFDQAIMSIDPGSDGLVLQPYWGAGLKRPNARGSIIGFSSTHTKYHFYRAIIEGLGYALREGLDEIVKKTHHVPSRIIVSGGGSTSDVICQIICDLFGIEVIQSETPETSTIGAAMSGFLAMKVFKTPQEAKEKMTKYGKVFQPNLENKKKYDYLYHNVYLKIYPGLKDAYTECKNFFQMENH